MDVENGPPRSDTGGLLPRSCSIHGLSAGGPPQMGSEATEEANLANVGLLVRLIDFSPAWRQVASHLNCSAESDWLARPVIPNPFIHVGDSLLEWNRIA